MAYAFPNRAVWPPGVINIIISPNHQNQSIRCKLFQRLLVVTLISITCAYSRCFL